METFDCSLTTLISCMLMKQNVNIEVTIGTLSNEDGDADDDGKEQ